MNNMKAVVFLLLIALPAFPGCGSSANEDDQQSAQATESTTMTDIVQHGSMREAISQQQQHQGRIRFADLVKQPHLFGVAVWPDSRAKPQLTGAPFS